jgi:hypothetical protein
MIKLTVIETAEYEFQVPDDFEATTGAAEEFFCNLDNPRSEASYLAVMERDFELEDAEGNEIVMDADLVAPRKESCEFVEASALVPASWAPQFWDRASEDAPFCWGNNNRSLVRASRFRAHCEESFVDEDAPSRLGIPLPAWAAFMGRLKDLGETYIDLES